MSPLSPAGSEYFGYDNVSNNTMDSNGQENLGAEENQMSSNTGNNDFAEYLWMENEEEFDNQILKQLEEEELMEQCLEAMLEEERCSYASERMFVNNKHQADNSSNPDVLNIAKFKFVDIEKSTLNPLATEFVPNSNHGMIHVISNKE